MSLYLCVGISCRNKIVDSSCSSSKPTYFDLLKKGDSLHHKILHKTTTTGNTS